MPDTSMPGGPATFAHAVEAVRGGADPEDQAHRLYESLTSQERLWLLDGDQPFWEGIGEWERVGYNTTPIVMGAVDRIGVPGLRFGDGPRGVVIGRSTAFPVPMARGATWDVELERRVGLAIGRELRAQGGNFFGGVCINLPRHPAWGRAQETYGDDPILLGAMGAALVEGVQRNAMAVAKHFALNSMENARFVVDVRIEDAALYEVYLPHFRKVVEAGVAGVMTAYNSVNGTWAGQNERLLQDILRDEWGFRGVTVSDFVWGVRGAAESLRAGLDVEEPFRQQRATHLVYDLESGRATWHDVTRAAIRILSTQLRFHASDLEPSPPASVVFCDEHRELAREVAATSVVLLQNGEVDGSKTLPIDEDSVSRIAVIGRLSDLPNTGDHGSSNVRSPHVITPLEGLAAALPHADLVHVPQDDPGAAAAAAAASDACVIIVGYTAHDEGEYIGNDAMRDPALTALYPPPEADAPRPRSDGIPFGAAVGGDRARLRLRPVDVEIIREVARANARTVVVLVTAGAVVCEEWRHEVSALVVGWYSGSEGGAALADVLLGRVDATGRLPYAIPVTEDHLPYFDRDATVIEYDRWHGQRLLDRDGHHAAFPLGFGLSYTTFATSDLSLSPVGDDEFRAEVSVTNVGDRRGRHVVQLYGVTDARDFPRRVLLGFAPVWLEPGASARIEVVGSTRPLQRWRDGAFHPIARDVRIEAAAFSGDPTALSQYLRIGEADEVGGRAHAR